MSFLWSQNRQKKCFKNYLDTKKIFEQSEIVKCIHFFPQRPITYLKIKAQSKTGLKIIVFIHTHILLQNTKKYSENQNRE